MNYNRCIFVGRLVADPEARSTQSGTSVTTFRIAVDRPQSSEARNAGSPKEADFINIVTFRNQAEFSANYLTKGKLVLIEGRLQIREYVDANNGEKRRIAEIVADTVRFMEKREDEGGYDGGNDGYDDSPASRNQGGRGNGGNGGGSRGGSRGGGNNFNAPDDDMGDPFAE